MNYNISMNTIEPLNIMSESIIQPNTETPFHKLNHTWNLWAHLPHDTNWEKTSYKQISTFITVEETIAVLDHMPEILVKNCMLFIMKENIYPMWEEPLNRNGGCFSYKISNKNVYDAWKDLSYILVGETLCSNKAFVDSVTGITISPKKNFCIVKIWLSNCDFQNPAIILSDVTCISSQGCIFKKHAPEY